MRAHNLKTIAAILLIGQATSALATGIPVIDAAAITQWGMQMEKWVTQAEQMKSQIDSLQQQYDAITKNRGFGDRANDPKLRNYLSSDWQKVYDSVASGNVSGLTGKAGKEVKRNRIFDACDYETTIAAVQACESRAAAGSIDKANTSTAFDQAKARVDQIEELRGLIGSTNDAKGIAEVQARIAAEQAAIQNESIKIMLYQQLVAAEEKITAQKAHEANAKQFASDKHLELTPVEFE